MPGTQAPAAALTRPVNLRIRPETRALIDQAARLQGRSRSDFMIDAARRAAEEALIDQTFILTDLASYDRFVEMLDAPPPANDKLRKLMQTRAPWEKA